ncbi:MAG: SAM-dependent methyltransferase, partial [Exiguobacterium acetylicum]
MTETQTIDAMEDILKMLDARLREPEPFWDKFYEDRSKPVPFFKNIQDENLVRYVEEGWLSPGDALDL